MGLLFCLLQYAFAYLLYDFQGMANACNLNTQERRLGTQLMYVHFQLRNVAQT